MFFEKIALFTKDGDFLLIILRIGDKKIYKKIKGFITKKQAIWRNSQVQIGSFKKEIALGKKYENFQNLEKIHDLKNERIDD